MTLPDLMMSKNFFAFEKKVPAYTVLARLYPDLLLISQLF